MLVDISDVLTDKAFQELKKNQILRFEHRELRIVRINKKSKKCWAEDTKTYAEHEVHIVERDK